MANGETTEQKPSVLVVDDDSFNLRLMAEMCQSAGYQVFQASDGCQALDLARQHLPALVLLDAMMTGKDGFEVCRELRADPNTSEMAIIIVTALDDLESKMRGIEAGADDYVTKPFRLFELQQRMSAVLLTRHYRKQLASIRQQLQKLGEFDTPGRIGGFRALRNSLEYEYRRAIRYNHPLAVLLVDINDYEKVLENSGQKSAASLVGAVVVSLREILRAVDRIYRVEKDRFLILMPETDLNGGRVAAERIWLRLQQPQLHRQHPVAISACLLAFPHPRVQSVNDILHLLGQAAREEMSGHWLRVLE